MAKFKFTKRQFEDAIEPKREEESGEEESEEKRQLKETIKEIDNVYKSTPTRTYEDVTVPYGVEKSYEMPTEKETAKKAQSEISPFYDAKIQSLTTENEMAKQNVEDEKDELYQRAEESLKQLKKTYDNAKENTSNEAIKRGLARSSIILNQLSDLEQSHIGATGGVLTQRDKELSSLAKKIDELKLKLLNDTNELNEEKEKEISQRIESLLDKYKAEEKDVLEYNNRIRKQNAETLERLRAEGIDADETQSREYITMVADKMHAFYSYYYSLGENALTELMKDRDYIVKNVGEKIYENLRAQFLK